MKIPLSLGDAFTQTLATLEWLRAPRTVKEFADKLDVDVRTARGWISGWAARGWIRPAHFIRAGGTSGRPPLAYETDTPPACMQDLLPGRDELGLSEQQVGEKIPLEMRDYFSEPRTIFDYRHYAEVSWPTAKAHIEKWTRGGFLFDAGKRRAGHAPRAQLYCSDEARARLSVFESAAVEYQRWRAKNPGADLDTAD